MNLNQNIGWFMGIFAFVALFAGSSSFLANDANAQSAAIQFSNLSDADIDMILSVKAEMRAAKVQIN